jgi:hypothetical protein
MVYGLTYFLIFNKVFSKRNYFKYTLSLNRKMVHESIKERQGEVQKTGDLWEDEVISFLSHELNKHKLKIVKSKKKDIKTLFWNQLYVPTKRNGVWGDIDLIVFNERNKVIAVISCKVSLHGRLTESLFYWLLFKTLKRPFKFVFATNDKGRGQGEWKSEWGTNEKPTKDRELAEAYTDGVYVRNEKTILGGILKPIGDLAADLIKWNKEVK